MTWYLCPECGQKLFMITSDAVIKGLQIKCKKCRKLINVSISHNTINKCEP